VSAPDPSSGAESEPRSGNDSGPGGRAGADVSDTIESLATEDLELAQRRQLLRRLARHAPYKRLWRPRAALRWMADSVTAIAPHVPVRDLPTLQAHYHGLAGEALAERLVRNAAMASAGVGAAAGSVVAVNWTAPPTLLSAPVLLGVETVAVVAIELKMIGELHAAYGVPITGGATERAGALLRSWSQQRGVNPMLPTAGIGVVLSTALRKDLTERLVRRFGRNLPTMAPLLVGAAVASYLNRKSTRSLGDRLRTDLGARVPGVAPAGQLPGGPAPGAAAGDQPH
jgi:hypothetical protein